MSGGGIYGSTHKQYIKDQMQEEATSLDKLRDHCCAFRSAIELCERNQLPITFHNFPGGSCGDAALLLAKYLEELGFGRFDYMLGQRAGHSHAWLQREELIVDITGDQFEDMPYSVFVETESTWHERFSASPLHVADFEIYDEATRFTLRRAYSIVRGQLR